MPSPENLHCADCIGAFSFPVPINIEIGRRVCTGQADMTSGVARNFRQGVRKSVAFLSVHSRLAALPSDRPYNQKKSWHIIPPEWLKNIGTSARLYTRRPITLRNHIYLPKNYVFSWHGVRTPLVWLRHWTWRQNRKYTLPGLSQHRQSTAVTTKDSAGLRGLLLMLQH